jgi:Arsenical resistance operon trans-acting repressor ArsD.
MTPDNPSAASAPASAIPADIEIFDPPMCCPTGLCGPTLDQTLLDVDEMVLELQAEGLRVERYQMTGHPQAFLQNAEVMALVRERQMDALPITVVRSKVVRTGAYPALSEVRAAVNGASDG